MFFVRSPVRLLVVFQYWWRMFAGLSDDLLENKVVLRRLDADLRVAGLLICSLPLPQGASTDWRLDGRATARHALGQWPHAERFAPRRLLLAADSGGEAPDVLRLTRAARDADYSPPEATLERFAESPEPEFYWERHLLKIKWRGFSFGLAMGLRVGEALHWWEACRLVTREETPECRVIEVGGAIPLLLTTADDLRAAPGYDFPLLHRHNWLNGHVYARLHANGVCEVFAHHVNARFFDDGLQLDDAVPVLGLRVEGLDSAATAEACGVWDGTKPELRLGAVRLDCRDVNHLATPEQPGRIDAADGFIVWQPYMGMELFGGLCPEKRAADPWIVRAEQRRIPRGMARTLRFSVSLNPERSPRTARYQAPAWWYGLCGEFSHKPLLPVFNEYDSGFEACRSFVRSTVRQGGFEDGCIARNTTRVGPHCEPGWEGEMPYGLFLLAWRFGGFEDHDWAMRSAYYVSDVSVDHAACAFRMHGYAPNAFALPMQRVHASVAAYLETGDPYLLQTARSVIDNAYWTHKNSWPRMAVGRDACFVRGAVLLYRYFADEHYRDLARDAAGDVAQSQQADGSFGDQGGGAGIHAWAAYITKPWMGCMAVGGLLDYLEVVGDDPELFRAVRRFADWLLRNRFDYNGSKVLRYQHAYCGKLDFYDFPARKWMKLSDTFIWHYEYLARLWPYCSIRCNDAAYFEAWAESFSGRHDPLKSDHACAQYCQYIPWLQDRLWNVRMLDDGGFAAEPPAWGARMPRAARVCTPEGTFHLAWINGSAVAEPSGKIRMNS